MSRALPTFTIVVLGQKGSGKTTCVWKYVFNQMPNEYVPTIMDTYQKTIKVDSNDGMLEIVDTGGVFQSVWYKLADAFLVTSHHGVSFLADKESVRKIRQHSTTAPIALVKTRCDATYGAKLGNRSKHQDLMKQVDGQYFEAEYMVDVHKAFEHLVRELSKSHSKASSTPFTTRELYHPSRGFGSFLSKHTGQVKDLSSAHTSPLLVWLHCHSVFGLMIFIIACRYMLSKGTLADVQSDVFPGLGAFSFRA